MPCRAVPCRRAEPTCRARGMARHTCAWHDPITITGYKIWKMTKSRVSYLKFNLFLKPDFKKNKESVPKKKKKKNYFLMQKEENYAFLHSISDPSQVIPHPALHQHRKRDYRDASPSISTQTASRSKTKTKTSIDSPLRIFPPS